MKNEMRHALNEIKRYSDLKLAIRIARGQISDGIQPVDLSDEQAEAVIDAMKTLCNYCAMCETSLEAHIDDLSNEEQS